MYKIKWKQHYIVSFFLLLFIDDVHEISSERCLSFKVEYKMLEQKMITLHKFAILYISQKSTHTSSLETELMFYF